MRMVPGMVAIVVGAVSVVGACGGSAKKPEPKLVANGEDPHVAREQAIEAARNAGILGAYALCDGGSTYGGAAYGGDAYGGATYGCYGGAFASITGTGDLSSGFDDSNIYGGLLGNDPGEMGGFGYGGFGYGGYASGSGSGGGGSGEGWGTIGTGRYGTIGHGSGTGSGYGTGGGTTAHPTGPTVAIGQPNAQGDLDKAIIRRYIKRNIQKITYCYEKQLVDKPGIAGTVMATFTIGVDGVVTASKASGVDRDVSACVAGVIGAIEFPKPKSGGKVQVNYPFVFRSK